MTKLTKPVVRITTILTDHRREDRSSDRVVVTLYPGGLIGFRQLRSKTEYVLDLATAYTLAMRIEVESKRKQKRERE